MHGNDKESQLIWEAYVTEEVKIRGKNVDPEQMNPEPGDESWLTKGERDGGRPGDDKVPTTDVELPAQSLNPSQSEIYLGKSLGMAVGGMGNGGNLNAIISGDNHILDGHHRWAATMLANPEAVVGGKQSALPIAELIPVLRGAGMAYGNPFRGKESATDINVYQADSNELQKQIEILDQGTKFLKPGQASEFVASVGGIEQLSARMTAIQQKKPPASAPPRDQMPVIDSEGPKSGKNEVQDAAARLNKGEIDVYPPYADE